MLRQKRLIPWLSRRPEIRSQTSGSEIQGVPDGQGSFHRSTGTQIHQLALVSDCGCGLIAETTETEEPHSDSHCNRNVGRAQESKHADCLSIGTANHRFLFV